NSWNSDGGFNASGAHLIEFAAGGISKYLTPDPGPGNSYNLIGIENHCVLLYQPDPQWSSDQYTPGNSNPIPPLYRYDLCQNPPAQLPAYGNDSARILSAAEVLPSGDILATQVVGGP